MLRTRKIFMFRHGETDWNCQRRWQGQTDVPLNAKGRSQAISLAAASKNWKIEAVFSSDLIRASETAQIIADSLTVPLNLEVDLREGNFGHAEGMTKDEILQKYGQDFVRRWKSLDERHLDLCFPEGETRRQILRRYVGCLERILSNSRWSTFAISTHGSILKHFIQFIAPTFSVPTPIPNCATFEVEFDEDTKSYQLNGMHRLDVNGNLNDPGPGVQPVQV